jgi:signal transduction histidine kinase/CheY-like chemotaxis protein
MVNAAPVIRHAPVRALFSDAMSPSGHAPAWIRNRKDMLLRFRHRIAGPVVGAWLLITAASVVLGASVWKRLAKDVDESAATARLRDGVDGVYSLALEAESGNRAYLLTGNETWLATSRRARALLPDAFHRLGQIAIGHPDRQADLLDFRAATELLMAALDEAARLRRDKGAAAAAAFVNTGPGKAAAERARELAGRLQRDPGPFLSRADEAVRRHVEFGYFAMVGAGCLGIGSGLLGLYLVRIGYLQEKSRRELLEEKLVAEKTVVEKSAFLANMSHEIRTPMNAILGFSELLESGPLTPRQSQYIRSIRQSGAALLRLINDILDLSKLEAGKLELCLESTDIGELFEFLQTLFSQQAAAKSLRLEFDAGAVPRALFLDRLRLRQILVNLVGNAIKFTRVGGVRIRAHWEEHAGDRSCGELSFDVADTGIGVSPERQEEIFKPFVQSDPRPAGDNEGTGLGLHIVQRLTDLMGGSVQIESEPSKGSVFRLRFPNVPLSARLPVSDGAETLGPSNFNDFSPATLLVVDDNAANRELLSGIFEGSRHAVLVARDVAEGLGIIAKTKVDLALVDMRMPGRDGSAMLAEIRRRPGLELLPVIAVTASSAPKEESELRAQFSGFLRKPFTRQVLYAELAQFLPRSPGPVLTASLVAGESALPPGETGLPDEALISELRVLADTEWPALRQSLAINETAAFARKLRHLGFRARRGALVRYAEGLAEAAETYSVADLERRLAEFPAIAQPAPRNQAISP